MKKTSFLLLLCSVPFLKAQTTFTSTTTNITGSSTSYIATVEEPDFLTAFTTGSSYPHNFSGAKNIKVVSVNANGKTYFPMGTNPQVILRRNNLSGQAGATAQPLPWNDRQIFFAEGTADGVNHTINAVTTYPGVINSTDQPALNVLRSGYLNTGIDNIFTNIEVPNTGGNINANNIERIDFIYPTPIKITSSNLSSGGIIISNRGSNDDGLVFSAIKNITGGSNFGTGTNYMYSNIISLNTTWTQKRINGGAFTSLAAPKTSLYTIPSSITFRERDVDGSLDAKTSTGNPSANNVVPSQSVDGLFFTFQDMGLQAGDYFYGFSVAAPDFPVSSGSNGMNSYLDPTYFPLKTDQVVGGLDLILNGVFYLLNVSGYVWNDINANGIFDTLESYTDAGGLYAVLINSSNTVVDVSPIDASTGGYILNNLTLNTTGYKIVLTTNNPSIGSTYISGPSLPAYWINTADVVDPSNSAIQGTELGVIELNTQADNIVNQNFGIKATYCYLPPVTSGTVLNTNHGITALGRAGAQNGNWPMIRKGAWTALEAKSKGFVINRIPTTAQLEAIPNPLEGMMVYDEEADCLKININGTSSGWKCFSTPTCPN